MIIDEYDPRWPADFARVRSFVRGAVADVAIAIEHVGSTAVPGLAAKPVIDIDVVVAPDDVGAGIAALESIGYGHRGDLGIPLREAFRAPSDDLPRHHLYLCPSSSPALANHLAVRDFLRSNASAAANYAALKQRLAQRFRDDIDGYIEGKSAFLLRVLREAGFPKHALDDIERMNARD